MAKYDTTLLSGEKIFMENGANLIVNGGANSRGGHVALTNYRLMFQAHGFNFGKKFEEFYLKSIKRNEQGAYIVFVRGNDLIIQMDDGTVAQFVMGRGKAEMLKNSMESMLMQLSAVSTPNINTSQQTQPYIAEPQNVRQTPPDNTMKKPEPEIEAKPDINRSETWTDESLKAMGYSSASEAYLDMQRKNTSQQQLTPSVPVTADTSPVAAASETPKEKGLFGKMTDTIYRKRQDAAVRAAYRAEEEKRKPHVKQIVHERELDPIDQQTLALLKTQRDAYYAQHFDISKIGKNLELSTAMRSYNTQIAEIERKRFWVEEITIPPEIDPSVPIEIDEEAIRNSVKRIL